MKAHDLDNLHWLGAITLIMCICITDYVFGVVGLNTSS